MKKLLILPAVCLILAGCGGSGLPSECEQALKGYDSLVAEFGKNDNSAQMKTQMEQARTALEAQLKNLNKDQAIQACKAVNSSVEQMKAALPK